MMFNLIAVDPGDIHVGVAFFSRAEDGKFGWECTETQELTPNEFLDRLAELFVEQDPEWEFLVYEKFRLYEDKSAEQTGSEFPTAKCIGVIEWLGRKHNEHASQHAHADATGAVISCRLEGGVCHSNRPGGPRHPRAIELVKQPADILNPTRGNTKTLGIKSTAAREGDKLGHRKAAELHGWYFILHNLRKRGGENEKRVSVRGAQT